MGGEPSKDVCRQRSNSDQLFEKPKEKKGFGGSLRVKRLSKRFGKSELKKLQNSFGPSEVIPTTEEPSPLTEEQKEKLEKNRVFSVPLALAASRSDPDGLIPSPISTCIAWLDPDHLEVEGIYRLSGSMRIIKDYVQLFDLGCASFLFVYIIYRYVILFFVFFNCFFFFFFFFEWFLTYC